MKTFTITKKQIINALTTEPIGSTGGIYASSKPFGKTVKVSAVGAVLRSLAASHKSAKAIFALTRDGFNTVAAYNANTVEALRSLENEYATMRAAMNAPKLRTTLASWVKDVFPAKIEVSLFNPSDVKANESQAAA